MFDVAIIGCGIVGAAAAYELSKYRLKVLMLEKENDVATGTTRANSAILHAGYDPMPGTLMARLNVRGSVLAREQCQRLSVPYSPCGSMVLAFSDADKLTIERLLERGKKNAVPGLCILSGEEARAKEPNLSEKVIAALYAPSAAIVCPWEYCLALCEVAVQNGTTLERERTVTGIAQTAAGFVITTNAGEYQARYILNAAGVQADKIHNMVAPPAFSIVPDRGEYYLLDKAQGQRVQSVIFQCPTQVGKGTLISPTVHGNLIVGPNNEAPADCTDVSTTKAGLLEVAEMAKKSMPSVNLRESIRNFAGVRAQSDRQDFIIGPAEGCPRLIDLAGIKSPGLTAAPAIGEYAVTLLAAAGLPLVENQSFVEHRRVTRFNALSTKERQALVAERPEFGRVVCRCETITEGEILEAIHAPIPPRSIDGIKRRVGAGMGRCQGGFCGPRVLELLAKELSISPLEVLQDCHGSNVLIKETKGGVPHE